MLRKGMRFQMSLMYWIILLAIFIIVSYKNLFFDWSIQNYLTNEFEFEIFGRYAFILFTSFLESFIYILMIRFSIFLLNKAFAKTTAAKSE
ncbi:hypothetical protein [Lysinibacillus sp. FJAT-14222]|uniref:hypothetical protein n=1 Tax=Lysinibacillus sp. FJAT-14222 TaxID=1932366 RepID=UPI0006AD8FD4|nr:hypothetical protein [Lysinibacillus sp. FJAT-14222]KOS63976.1 hypothetical protein AN161_05245 [Lysinibacillus sp. FJAT-14222]